MFWIALKLFFLGAVAALLIHPYLGLGVIGLAFALVTWELWAFVALPFIWLGTELLKLWAKIGAQAPEPEPAKPVRVRSRPVGKP